MPFGDPGGNFSSGGAFNQGGPSGPNSPGNMGNMGNMGGGAGGSNFSSAYSGSRAYYPGSGRLTINNPFGAWDYSPAQLSTIYGNTNYTNNPMSGFPDRSNPGYLRDPGYRSDLAGAGGANSGQGGMGAGGVNGILAALAQHDFQRRNTPRRKSGHSLTSYLQERNNATG